MFDTVLQAIKDNIAIALAREDVDPIYGRPGQKTRDIIIMNGIRSHV